jgi:hypothetical protein
MHRRPQTPVPTLLTVCHVEQILDSVPETQTAHTSLSLQESVADTTAPHAESGAAADAVTAAGDSTSSVPQGPELADVADAAGAAAEVAGAEASTKDIQAAIRAVYSSPQNAAKLQQQTIVLTEAATGIAVDTVDPATGATALIAAARQGLTHSVELLQRRGARLNVRCAQGLTAEQHAWQRGYGTWALEGCNRASSFTNMNICIKKCYADAGNVW